MIGRWNKDNNGNLSRKLIDKIRPDVPLNTKIDAAKKKLGCQIDRLEAIHANLKKKHDFVFSKIVEAQKSNNVSYARGYATELCEIRKMESMVSNASLSMKQVQMRLDTVSQLGDIRVTLSPCMSIIKGLGSMGNIMPQADETMQDLYDIMGGMMSGTSVGGPAAVDAPQHVSNDAQSILEEAHRIIEDQTRSSIPDIPTDLKKDIVAGRAELI